MIELAQQYGRYGYRRIAALFRNAGWQVNDKRVEQLWRREWLKVPYKQPKKSRLWLNDRSCVRLRALHPNHVWSYDFVHHRTDDGRVFRTLDLLDEFTRECQAIRVKRKLNSNDVIDVLTDQFILRGVPMFSRSDNGPTFIACVSAASPGKHDPVAIEPIKERTFNTGQSIGAGQPPIHVGLQFCLGVFSPAYSASFTASAST